MRGDKISAIISFLSISESRPKYRTLLRVRKPLRALVEGRPQGPSHVFTDCPADRLAYPTEQFCSVQEQTDPTSPQNSESRWHSAKTGLLIFKTFVPIKPSCSLLFQVWVSRLVEPRATFLESEWMEDMCGASLSGEAKGVFISFVIYPSV